MQSTLTDNISLTFRVLTSPDITDKAIEKLPFSITHERIETVSLNKVEQGETGPKDKVKIIIMTFIIKLDDAINSNGLETLVCWMQYHLKHKDVFGISHVDAELLKTP